MNNALVRLPWQNMMHISVAHLSDFGVKPLRFLMRVLTPRLWFSGD